MTKRKRQEESPPETEQPAEENPITSLIVYEGEETVEVVAEEIPEEPKTPEPPKYREIKINDFIALKRAGVENAPDAPHPFWFFAHEGLFQSRHTAIGRAIVPQKHVPAHLPKLGVDKKFWWEVDKVPQALCEQIYNFFADVFEQHGTEAEVILLMHKETKEWGVYVPHQRTTYSSVTHAMAPEEVPEGYLIVGTMHSHCDFSAFHSGTDTGDASDMDGIHFTLGKINGEKTFEVAVMVMISGVEFKQSWGDVSDFNGMKKVEVPEEWMARIYPNGATMSDEIKELFEKYAKTRTNTVTTTPRTYTPTTPYTGNFGYGSWDDDDWRNWQYNSQYRKPESTTVIPPNKPAENNTNVWERMKQKANRPHWEDFVDDKFIDKMLASDLFTEDDLDECYEKPFDALQPEFWQSMWLRKLAEVVSMLNYVGMNVDYTAKPKEQKPQMSNRERKRIERKQRRAAHRTQHVAQRLEREDLLPDDTSRRSLEEELKQAGFKITKVSDHGRYVEIDVGKV